MTTYNKAVSFFETEYPLVKLFNYGDEFLVYDAKPHFAFIISNVELGILIDFLNGKTEEELISRHAQHLDKVNVNKLFVKYLYLKKSLVFSKGPLDQISPTDKNEIKKSIIYFDKNILLRKFCLEVTEDCNYRCKYCKRTIATDYRVHSKNNLSERNACKAIDYYFEKYTAFFMKLSAEKKELLLQAAPPSLSWYGGEPFLNFELIKKSAAYFKGMPWNEYGINIKDIRFSSNTNLSVITDEILNFLVDNSVHLFASLDGPEEEHDKYRVFENGAGTFQTAYNNLLKIKKFNESYFKKLVSIFGVYADRHDPKRCKDFIRNIGASSFQHFPAEYSGLFIAEPKAASEFYEKSIKNNLAEFKQKVLAVLESRERNIDDFSNLFPFAKLNYDHPGGKNSLNISITCPMGFDNLMVTANGNFLICHKVNDSMPIGDCDSGLNHEKLLEINHRYNSAINNEECRKCWNVNFCSICAASRMVNGRFVNPTKSECDFFRLRAVYNFHCFIHLSMDHPELLEKIFKYRNSLKHYVGIIDKNDF